MQQLLELAAEEAQLKGIELGLRQTGEGFDFLALEPGGRWQSFDGGPLRPREIAAPFYLELRVEGRLIAPAQVDRRKERMESEQAAQAAAEAKPNDDGQSKAEKENQENRVQPQVYLLSSGESTPFTLDLKLRNYAGYYRLDCDLLARCKLERRQERT